MKRAFSIFILLMSFHYVVAQDNYSVPEWFENPSVGEYVGVSLPYGDENCARNSAKLSAILSVILESKKEIISKTIEKSPIHRVDSTDNTIIQYALLNGNNSKVGRVTLSFKSNSYSSDTSWDEGYINRIMSESKADIDFSLSNTIDVIKEFRNPDGTIWTSIRFSNSKTNDSIIGNIKLSKRFDSMQGSEEEYENQDLFVLLEIQNKHNQIRLELSQSKDSIDVYQLQNDEDYEYRCKNTSIDTKFLQNDLKNELESIGYGFNGINYAFPADYPRGHGYLLNQIHVIEDFAFLGSKELFEIGMKNVGNYFRKGFSQIYYMPLETKSKPLYAINSNDERPNNNTFVIIIGNEDYQMVETVPYAKKDAKAFEEYCQRMLNVPQNQITIFEDASYGKMKMAIKRLKEVAKAYQGDLKVIFYYAGHGIPDEESKNSYLLPIDADGTMPEVCYSLNDLYSDLGSLNAKQVVVFMDACFSGANRSGKMLQSARGVAIKAKEGMLKGNMVVFSAASGEQTAYPYKSKEHGLFTYYLLNKLEKEKGNVTLGELAKYIVSEVGKTSIVENKKSQTPTVGHSASLANKWQDLKLRE